MDTLTITLFQQDLAWQSPEANRRWAEAAFAAAPASDMLVLPETFTSGFGHRMADLAEDEDGPTLQWARQMASRHGALVAGTWVVRTAGRCRNRLHWVFPDGTAGHYDKAHLFAPGGEAGQMERGTEKPVFEWHGWRIRPAVCYDLRFPTWLRNRRTSPSGLDYDLLLLCANWPASRRHTWDTLLRARAIENLCYVAGCNRAGTDATGIAYSGDSLVADCKGQTVALAGSHEQLLTATLDREALHSFRRRWPFHLDFD